ncbi:MAG: DUF2167 domain-containing protein [Massilia sp.]|nr:DUF2167 domain-containing protein [Massilia sp.]
MKKLFAVLCLLTLSLLAQAEDQPKMSAEQFLASLSPQQGDIALPGNIATLKLPAAFRYLSPADADKVLSQAWGNPPGTKSLGMIVPAGASVLSDTGWGVIITYDKDGHVKDGDADTIKYDELLKQIQEGTEENNAERKKQGYPAMHVVGWAEPPSYDKAAHKLYWAKELHSDGAEGSSLNYNIRVLGREGVLVLNAVASMGQLAQIRDEMKQVTAFTNFTSGNGYADFNDKTDKVAEYGLAALVAGGVAAKLGFFGKIFALLLAFKKLLIVGVLAIGSFVMKLLGREKKVDLTKAPDA